MYISGKPLARTTGDPELRITSHSSFMAQYCGSRPAIQCGLSSACQNSESKDKNPDRVGLTCVIAINSHSIFGFLHWKYCKKYVLIQIPNYDSWTSVPYTFRNVSQRESSLIAIGLGHCTFS